MKKKHARKERLEVAARILAGFLANPGPVNFVDRDKDGEMLNTIQYEALDHADLLLDLLDKKEVKK